MSGGRMNLMNRTDGDLGSQRNLLRALHRGRGLRRGLDPRLGLPLTRLQLQGAGRRRRVVFVEIHWQIRYSIPSIFPPMKFGENVVYPKIP